MSGGKVVTAIQHDIRLGNQVVQQRRVGTRMNGNDGDRGIQSADGNLSRIDLGQANAAHGVGNLPLQIGHVYRVVVDDGYVTYSGRAQKKRNGRAQPSRTNDQRSAAHDSLLAFYSNFIKQDVARIAQ